MYTDMEMWRDIRRRVLVEGESKRSVQRAYGIHFTTLQKILEHAEPPGYRAIKSREKRKIGPYLGIIQAILKSDEAAPKKQRHTATRIYERLREEYGFDGGYTIVREAVREIKHRNAEVFVPLLHRPGEAQVDFGFADVDFPEERLKAAIFVMTLPQSDAFFCCAFPRECTETFQQGHVWAFEYFGGVPHRISYDNSKVAVIKVGEGRQRQLTREFLRLQSHYMYEEHFCLVRRPNEKGHVETLVGFTRRNFLVPVPSVDSWEALNAYLLRRCRDDLSRSVRGKEGNKSERLVIDQKAMLPLPKQRFEARRVEKTRANSLSLVRFDRNDYSVPTEYAHCPITAIGGIDKIKLVFENRLVAEHRRSWKREKAFFEPIHYLALLERKPGAFDYARPLQDWQLPDSFQLLRRRLESKLDSKGIREYIKILRLLERASLRELHLAVERGLAIGAIDSDAIRLLLETIQEPTVTTFCLEGRPHLTTVRVQQVDLSAYQVLATEAAR